MTPVTATLGVRRRIVIAGVPDRHGNPTFTFSEPQPWPVWGIAPGAAEPHEPNRDLSIVEWTVYAPMSPALPGELDRVILDDVEYEVEGRALDWTRGPWPHPTAGAVVELKRPEG